MGRLIVEQIITADGFAADSDGGMKFMQFSASGFEVDQEQLDMLANVDAIVLGRVTYGMFADYWPNADPAREAVATPINALPKHVVSNTLERAPWGDGEIQIERGDGVESLRALKARYPRDVIVWGSLDLTDDLLLAGVVDVLRLRIVPGLIGTGRTIAPAALAPTSLTLEKTHVYEGGQVVLQYAVNQ